MTEGRTYWYAEDATYLSRALVIELGDEFGPAVVGVLQSIKSHAKLQNDGGRVKTGLATVNRESFAGDSGLCRRIIERAAEIGVLDELEWSDERRFKCRVSGWEADQGKGYETVRKRWQRDAQDPSDNTDPPCPDPRDKPGHGPETGDGVTASPPTGQDRTVNNSHVEPARLDEARERLRAEDVQQVFDEWITSTGKTNRTVLDDKRRRTIRKALKSYPLDDVLDAVRGWKLSPHHRGDNATATVYNDLGLLLRDGEHIERFRDLQRGARSLSTPDQMEAFRRQQARLRERNEREEQGA